ncbi:hypothetical protein PENTCL1PPCAC_8182, partial [Pristionchus entomophagus]
TDSSSNMKNVIILALVSFFVVSTKAAALPHSSDAINEANINRGVEQNTQMLLNEAEGKVSIRTSHGKCLRPHDIWTDGVVDKLRNVTEDNWKIEEDDGKVVLKSVHKPVRILRAFPDPTVDIAPYAQQYHKWTPYKNEDDDSWSFQGANGRWLSVDEDGVVRNLRRCGAQERFWIENACEGECEE